MKTACDLACGTGITALSLASSGIKTFAVDLSPSMCKLSRAKALHRRVPLHVIQADMRSFRLPRPVDLITCESDAINHVPHRVDLRDVLESVSRALRPGGYFFFDVNNARGFRQYWKGNVWLEKPGVVLIMRNGHSADALRAWSDIEWFIREGRVWRRHQERVEEVCWTREEICDCLRSVHLRLIGTWDATRFFRENPAVTRGCHTIYLARKAR